MRQSLRTLALATAAATLVAAPASLAVATAASAAPTKATSCLSRVQANADRAVTVRLRTLNVLEHRVTAAKRFTPAQKASYLAVITQDRSGLTTLKATIDADTSCAAAKADAARIVTDYRVFRLLVPQIALTRSIAKQNASAAGLLKTAAALQTRIDAAKAAGKDTTRAQADHDVIVADVAAAQASINGLADKIAALTPTDVTKGSKPLAFARAALKAGGKDLAAASRAVRTTRADLRAL